GRRYRPPDGFRPLDARPLGGPAPDRHGVEAMAVIPAVIDYGAHRADDWKLPLFVHISGAMLLVGALTLATVSLIVAWRSGSVALTRLGLKSVLYGAVPGWIVMRGGAQWIAHKEGLDNDNVDLTWLNIGFTTSDLGLVFLIVLLVIGGL